MFIRYENLSHKNSTIQRIRFVKSITRRPKVADIFLANDFIVEARLHVYSDAQVRRWDKKKPGCFGYCSSGHHTVFASKDKLFFITKSETKEFKNQWLLKHIMNAVFKERK
jgi:hypothetical protein